MKNNDLAMRKTKNKIQDIDCAKNLEYNMSKPGNLCGFFLEKWNIPKPLAL